MTEINKEDFIPAKWTSQFKIAVTDDLARIAFGDAIVENDGIYHTSLVMSTGQLAYLAAIINQTLQDHQENAAKAAKANKKS